MLTHGSGEVLTLIGSALLQGGKKVIGVDPTYGTVYQHASNIKAEAIRIPLTKDYRQPMDQIIEAANKHKDRSRLRLHLQPEQPDGQHRHQARDQAAARQHSGDMPVLIDEAYHHYVDDPDYATSMPYVNEGRQVIVARTFSKIAAMAAMRVGYAVAQPTTDRRRCASTRRGVVNVLAQLRRRGRAQGQGGDGRGQVEDDRAPREDDQGPARRPRLRSHPVAGELLHGRPQARSAAGHPGVPRGEACSSAVRSRR